MKGVLMDDSKRALLDDQLAVGPFSTNNAYMGLMQGVSAVNRADSTATILAFEPVFGGYARQLLQNPTASSISAGVARSNFDLVTFTNSSGSDQMIDGWFYYDNATNKVMMAGLYDTPVLIPNGDTFPTRPFWTRQGHFDDSP